MISSSWEGEGNGNPLQYSCLGNPTDRGAWWAAVRGDTDTTEQLHFHSLEKEMATHSGVLAWRIPGAGAWWAAIYGVTQSCTRLMWPTPNLLLSPQEAFFITVRLFFISNISFWFSLMISISLLTFFNSAYIFSILSHRAPNHRYF